MEYQFIVNPQTNRKCSIHSRQGQRIIKNYINQSGSGMFGPSEKVVNHCKNTCNRETLAECGKALKGSKYYTAWEQNCGANALSQRELQEFKARERAQAEKDAAARARAAAARKRSLLY